MRRQSEHSLRRFFASRSFLVVSLVVAILVAMSFARAYYEDYKVRQEIKNLQEEVKQLEKKKFDSIELLKYVSSDNFVEEKARTELNLKKNGENVVFIEEGADIEDAVVEELEEGKSYLSNAKKWWYYFTHNKTVNQ